MGEELQMGGVLIPPEDAWERSYRKRSPYWISSASSSREAVPISVSRVNQVDAGRLNVEMSAMLKEKLV